MLRFQAIEHIFQPRVLQALAVDTGHTNHQAPHIAPLLMFQATQNITSVHIQVTIERSREAFIAGSTILSKMYNSQSSSL